MNGPKREIVRKLRDPKGFVIAEVLECGHRLETAELHKQSQGRHKRMQHSSARFCKHCLEFAPVGSP